MEQYIIECKCNGFNIKEHVRKIYISSFLSYRVVWISCTWIANYSNPSFFQRVELCWFAWVRFQLLPIEICWTIIVVPSISTPLDSWSQNMSNRYHVAYRLSAPLHVWVPLPVWVMDKLGNSSEWHSIATRGEHRINGSSCVTYILLYSWICLNFLRLIWLAKQFGVYIYIWILLSCLFPSPFPTSIININEP